MTYRVRYIFPFLLLVLLMPGCKSDDAGDKAIEAEYITYRVNYLENMAGDIPTKMLPDKMEAYYSPKYILTSIDGFFGQFSLVQVAYLKQNSVTTMLNFFGNKVYYEGKKGEIPAGIVPIDNPRVEVTKDTVTICGFTSYRAIIQNEGNEYDIYFTRDIEINSPNITTPYHFIDHVLSDFRVQLSVLKMQLVMSGHESTSIPSSIFDIPEDYRQVSRETMESIINSLFTKD